MEKLLQKSERLAWEGLDEKEQLELLSPSQQTLYSMNKLTSSFPFYELVSFERS